MITLHHHVSFILLNNNRVLRYHFQALLSIISIVTDCKMASEQFSAILYQYRLFPGENNFQISNPFENE